MKTYNYKQIQELRTRLPYGCLKSLALELGYKYHSSVCYLFNSPNKWTLELYDKVELFIKNYSIGQAQKLGIVIDKDAQYCHESAKKYIKGLSLFINSPDYKTLSMQKRDKVIEDFKKIKKQLDQSTQTIYLQE